MGKKYIIELLDDCPSEFKGIIVFGLTPEGQISAEPIPVEDLTPYTEPDLGTLAKENFERGYRQRKAEEEKEIQGACQKGLSDAWDAARTLWNTPNRKEIFGYTVFSNALMSLTGQEVIEKIRQYEQEKEEQIQVGDEVVTDAGNRASVLYENPDGTQVFVFKSDGTAAWWTKSALHRTGRNFPEIAEVLQKMKES